VTTDPAKPGFRNSRTNWRESALPFFTKLGIAMRNNVIKLRTRRSCCGNYGQPGC
jgi:hypothetical protein